ncbi:MAG: SRPBCC family protein [Rhizobiales bacterium]|nr:SRPBCC family protein [Hyphomicrobiales bacterium]MBI3673453.1 SRPBCC family protein [Hyphomicrobiales bacterium]
MTAGQSHIASIMVNKDAAQVFAFMADPAKLNRWSFGTWETEVAPDGLVTGTSIFDGNKILVRIDADRERLSIDYRLGADPARLVPRVTVRIIPGANLGLDAGHCVLTFIAWRSSAMDDDRWRRLTSSHEFEVVLIKNLLENDRA